MYLDKNLEKKWLIKSESKILGPYSFDQIIELLRKKQISIIDEIRDPETRWLYVRENKDFQNVVEEIRKDLDSKQESTKTFQNTYGSHTNPGTKEQVTNVSLSFNSEELLSKIKPAKVENFENDENEVTNANFETKELEVLNETISSQSETTPVVKVEKGKIYGVESDSAVQQKISKYTTKLRITLAALFIVVSGIVGGYIFYQKQSDIKRGEELMSQVTKYKYRGLFKKAAEAYAVLPNESKKKVLPKVLDIYPILETIGAASIEQINELEKISDLSVQQSSLIQSIKFWQWVKSNNFDSAMDALLNASKKDPGSQLVKENIAWMEFQNKDYKTSYNTFKSIGPGEGLGRQLLGRFLNLLHYPDGSDLIVTQKELLSDIDKYTLVKFDLKKELLLAQMYLALKSNNEGLFRLTLNQFFLTVPLLSEFFYRPPLVFPNVATWKDLDLIKPTIAAKLSGDELILFETHNLIEQNQLSQASNYVDEQISKVSDPKMKTHLNLLLFYSQGRYKEALALKSVKELDSKNLLNAFMLARSQIKEDSAVALESYITDLAATEDKFYKNWLIVENMILKGKYSEAKKYISAHMATIDNFILISEAYAVEN
jgi:hypothetical protein